MRKPGPLPFGHSRWHLWQTTITSPVIIFVRKDSRRGEASLEKLNLILVRIDVDRLAVLGALSALGEFLVLVRLVAVALAVQGFFGI